MATTSVEHPNDLCLLYLDKNRNGNFTDDGPALSGVPTQNAKTKAWWTSVNKVELSVPYAALKSVEPYLVNFWIVREDSAAVPEVLRFSVGAWRYGTVTINGAQALAAAVANAKTTGKKIILDFEATWCGPCHTMDQWIWNDEEVAGAFNANFLGVKIDVDLDKALVKRFQTKGYPTMIVLDRSGKEIQRVVEYQSSKQMLAFLTAKP